MQNHLHTLALYIYIFFLLSQGPAKTNIDKDIKKRESPLNDEPPDAQEIQVKLLT